MKNSKAFTLIEISVVIVIIGLLIAGVAQASKMVKKSQISAARSITKQSPADDIEGLAVWYESVLEESFAEEESIDGSTVSNWNDLNPQSYSKNPATQTVANSRPNYVYEGINNLPALRFGGVKFLQMNNNFCARNTTIFAVLRIGASTANSPLDGWQVLFADSSNLANDSIPIVVAGSSALTFNGGSTDSWLYAANGALVTNDRPHLVTVTRSMDSGARSISVDGINNATDNNGAVGRELIANSNMLIGRSANNSQYNGLIGEIIIYSRVLNGSERASVENYLIKKWGINN